MGLVQMQNQFSGLPMDQLIGGPLKAACDSQLRLAQSTADFIHEIGFYDQNGISQTRTADFSFDRSVVTGQDGLGNDILEAETVKLSVPMLAIVNIPSLMIDSVDIIFDMEVKSSESHTDSTDMGAGFSGGARIGIPGLSCLSAHISISGSVASHIENTRKSDNSAKYHVQVHAADPGMPEGLARVLDIIAAAVSPTAVEGPQARKDKKLKTTLDPIVREKNRLIKDKELKQLEFKQKSKDLELLKTANENAENALSDKLAAFDINAFILEKIKTEVKA